MFHAKKLIFGRDFEAITAADITIISSSPTVLTMISIVCGSRALHDSLVPAYKERCQRAAPSVGRRDVPIDGEERNGNGKETSVSRRLIISNHNPTLP